MPAGPIPGFSWTLARRLVRPYSPMQWPGFAGGLNLTDQQDTVKPAEAVDLLDVSFTQLGGLKSRDGYTNFTTAEGTNRYDSLSPFYRTGSANQLMAGAGNRLDALNVSGGVVASSTAPTANPHFFARVGTPASELLYIANGTDTVRQWDGTTFTTPTYTGTTPTGMFLAVTPSDNRLACARTATNVSRVLFSDAGTPTTFGANNYVDLQPGDGEAIQGMVAWQNLLFVFKETKFFVFYGTSTDSSGNPVFNYRTVATGCGAVGGRAVCAARDGVYFMDRKGVYRSTGGAPELVSQMIDPFFLGGASSFFQSSTLNHAQLAKAALTWHEERLYLAVQTGSSTSNDRMLVFDPRYKWWSLYSIPGAALASFRIGNQAELAFAYGAGLKHVGRHSSAYTNDAGTAINSRWTSGWLEVAGGDVGTVREMKLWGTGKCFAGLTHDFQASGGLSNVNFASDTDLWGDGTTSDLWGDGTTSDTWAAAGSYKPKLLRVASRGTKFSLTLQADGSNTFSLIRAGLHVRDSRVPSVMTG